VKGLFFHLADTLSASLAAGETLLASFHGERSDFVRFNHGKVRQAGSVEQRFVSLRLVRARRQASAGVTLAGHEEDGETLGAMLVRLREALAAGDPFPGLPPRKLWHASGGSAGW